LINIAVWVFPQHSSIAKKQGENMDKLAWLRVFPGAITATDADGIILSMNDQSAEMFKDDGGYALLGHYAITCH
jgi:hypothetical protein